MIDQTAMVADDGTIFPLEFTTNPGYVYIPSTMTISRSRDRTPERFAHNDHMRIMDKLLDHSQYLKTGYGA